MARCSHCRGALLTPELMRGELARIERDMRSIRTIMLGIGPLSHAQQTEALQLATDVMLRTSALLSDSRGVCIRCSAAGGE